MLVFYSFNLVLSESVFLYLHIILVDGDIYMSLQMLHVLGYRICMITSCLQERFKGGYESECQIRKGYILFELL